MFLVNEDCKKHEQQFGKGKFAFFAKTNLPLPNRRNRRGGGSWNEMADDRLAWFRKKRRLVDLVDKAWEKDTLPYARVDVPKELEEQPNETYARFLRDTPDEAPPNPDQWNEPGVHGHLPEMTKAAEQSQSQSADPR
ncbi:hypothetical protein PTSG_01185 [Salpingoeca rosetta]|uniref:Uncharacterized protein n=1 Tax=Salpingoeca rosetta (strain ATCC 50818 / BSB-021) TaxID=946362 RepID=F2U122_SALR5|nr:uncharacterized protein PTSG_01185 [Salpingoeca rosetta]EGD80596.1 hypothetical protein PTSG_01185 [Salpingoeca rosetta]|eukprot:XP_004997157.1 hypothetical protein PTSG_01185 [Salpingoeca rosetta]